MTDRGGQPVAERLQQRLRFGQGHPSQATDKATSSTTPSATSSTQGRAVTDALKADPTPSGQRFAPSSSPSASAVREQRRPATAKLQAQYTALDCTKRRSARRPVTASRPTDPTVACGQNSQGQWQKYILGPAEVEGTDVD